jgi:glycosyltransferase involved in cell wall biosynthesis
MVLVPSSTLSAVVRRWGGSPVLLYDPPPPPVGQPLLDASERACIVWAGLAAEDEPLPLLLEVARCLPDRRFILAGPRDAILRRLPASGLPANVTLTGFVRGEAYLQLLAAADVVVALSTDEATAMRVACEATWLEVPLVVSDSATSREAFPHAVHSVNEVSALTDGIRRAPAAVDTTGARAAFERVVEEQLREVRSKLGPNGDQSGRSPVDGDAS